MNNRLQDADYALFRAEVEDAIPLDNEIAEPFRERPKPNPRPRVEEAPVDDPQLLSESEVETHDYLVFMRPGLQKRVLLSLQRGQIEPSLELDLHGLRVNHSGSLLQTFLADCAARRVRCAKIIHGKGRGSENRQPVLKCKVNYWLRLRPDVLAFCSAPRFDGGTGAVYVLLRNPEKAKRRR
ncbi:MAG: Smr/MutS family protein [Chromatiaceae bacterium]|nr:Smr/MutS family protein [Chromatiaceae bacterium]MCF7994925.1 Smr/MutS family protein [Chromatiaceae bacterium]MCF8014384.1 Smr/MutS family protein [Chromatiaceae bacterium]